MNQKNHDKENWPAEQRRRKKVMSLLGELMKVTNHGFGDEDSLREASVIYGVLGEKHYFNEMPESVVAYVETIIGSICDRMDIHAWNDYLLAPIMWLIAVGVPGGDNTFLAGIKHLCTEKEYKAFLTRHGLEGGEPEEDTQQERNAMAAFKAARHLAYPRTHVDTRDELQRAINELCMSTQVNAHHPALVERALTIMLETVEVRAKTRHSFTLSSVAERRRDRQRLFDLLDSLPDLPEGDK
jgi:hypothetical protein